MTELRLPRRWRKRVKLAVLHALSLARVCLTTSLAQASTSNEVQLATENEQLRQELAVTHEQLRIKDARMSRVPAARRPHYTPSERLSILELRAAMGWSNAQTAAIFHVTRATVSSWMSRMRRGDDETLLKTALPVNRFPDAVRYLVQRLKVLCPQLGKVKIAQVLCRAGLHLGATTVGRILKEPPSAPAASDSGQSPTLIVAEQPGEVWCMDLTTVPTGAGFWTSYLPWSMPPAWPFCWWIAVVFDQFSRRVLACEIYSSHPDSGDVCNLLDWTISRIGRTPLFLVTDGEGQFVSDRTRDWCSAHDVEPKVGRLGQFGSIAILDRFYRTLKETGTRPTLIAFRKQAARVSIGQFCEWYNAHRPHTTLDVRTPNEVYFGLDPACREPRFEPRPRWPRGSRCAVPEATVDDTARAVVFELRLLHGRRELPVVTRRRAA